MGGDRSKDLTDFPLPPSDEQYPFRRDGPNSYRGDTFLTRSIEQIPHEFRVGNPSLDHNVEDIFRMQTFMFVHS